jgi:hypothetical protein
LLRSLAGSYGALAVYRRGRRLEERGRRSGSQQRSLLPAVLGDDLEGVHPLVQRFYANPGLFAVRARLQLHSLPLMFYSRCAALLVGQGLYEASDSDIPARLETYRRDDGSMHFVRELYCRDRLRVFDSDFVVRSIAGRPTLVEVFVDLSVDVVLAVTVLDDGGLSVSGQDIYWRGVRLPRTGLHVDFVSEVHDDRPGASRSPGIFVCAHRPPSGACSCTLCCGGPSSSGASIITSSRGPSRAVRQLKMRAAPRGGRGLRLSALRR